MRVAILSTAPVDTHGWGRYTRDLISGLAQQPEPPEIIFITARDAVPTTNLPVKAMHRVLPSLTPARRFSLLRLLAALPAVSKLTADCDVIHVIAEPYALTVPIASKVVVTAHGTYTARTAAHKVAGELYRRVYQRATMICVSSYTEKQVKTALPNAHTVVIINGVNAAHYEQPGTPPTKTGPTILSVGQVKHRKGVHVLAKAMKAVRAAIPDAQAVFIGDTSDRAYVDKLQAQISADGLQSAITLTGRVSEDTLLGWYHAADVFALPSINVAGKFEGFGLVYLEASAAGLPVIGTRDCGAEDAIRDGETGYLIAQDNPATLAEVIIRLLTDDELRRKMAAAGRTFASENTWDRVAARVQAQYSQG